MMSEDAKEKYVIAAVKPWFAEAYERRVGKRSDVFSYLENPDTLSLDLLDKIGPRFVFFTHWPTRVPSEILNKYECVCFHMTDLPYGRGGSPLQNLILRGHEETQVCALRMVEELDAGPIYLKRPLTITGKAGDIYSNLADLVFDMIFNMIREKPTATPQTGLPSIFKRRKPADSELIKTGTDKDMYDHIRMVDAPTYPSAYLQWGEWVIEFSDACLTGSGGVISKVSIKKNKD